jgi:hypothetical protein
MLQIHINKAEQITFHQNKNGLIVQSLTTEPRLTQTS